MKTVTVQELKSWIEQGVDFQLVDVREPHERAICSLGGDFIPMNSVPARFSEINSAKKGVIYCRSGMRSANVISYLEHQEAYQNLYNLEGGILAWIAEIDPSLTPY